MSAADSERAVDRLGATRESMGAEDFAAHAFLMLGLLAYQAPEVFVFIADRCDHLTGRDA